MQGQRDILFRPSKIYSNRQSEIGVRIQNLQNTQHAQHRENRRMNSLLCRMVLGCTLFFYASFRNNDNLQYQGSSSVSGDSGLLPQQATKGNEASGRFDGPAELPRRTVDVSLPHQTGKVITLREGANLQEAIDRAQCGDTIELQSGASFVGAFKFPQTPCNDANWIVVRTASPDSALPPHGTRLTPCYAGVNALPGRPPLNCGSTKVVTARIEGKNSYGPITFAP